MNDGVAMAPRKPAPPGGPAEPARSGSPGARVQVPVHPPGHEKVAADWVPTAKRPIRGNGSSFTTAQTPTGGAVPLSTRLHKAKGWDELGYHFVIGNWQRLTPADGQVEVGSRWSQAEVGRPHQDSRQRIQRAWQSAFAWSATSMCLNPRRCANEGRWRRSYRI